MKGIEDTERESEREKEIVKEKERRRQSGREMHSGKRNNDREGCMREKLSERKKERECLDVMISMIL